MPHTSSSSLIRSASLSGYMELVEALGADPHALLRAVGLSPRLLAGHETRIPSRTVRELLEAAARVTGSEDFALQLAARRTLSNLGPISLVLKDAPTPRQALDTLCRYLKLLSATLITRTEDAGRLVIIREELLPIPGVPTRQAMELTVGMKFRILRELIGPTWRPLQVHFTHRAPADIKGHRTFFGCVPMFNQSFNGLVCTAADLQLSRTPDNSGGTRFALDYLESALAHRGEGIGESCRELILALLPGGRCTAQHLASLLRIDRRTLHRHLIADGLTFSGLLHELRVDLTTRYLQESDLPVGEVATMLGYTRHSSFAHWFHATFGCSVSEWRHGLAAPDKPT